jgi:hypothetical protein
VPRLNCLKGVDSAIATNVEQIIEFDIQRLHFETSGHDWQRWHWQRQPIS